MRTTSQPYRIVMTGEDGTEWEFKGVSDVDFSVRDRRDNDRFWWDLGYQPTTDLRYTLDFSTDHYTVKIPQEAPPEPKSWRKNIRRMYRGAE